MRTTQLTLVGILIYGQAFAAGVIPSPGVPISGATLPGPFSLSYGAGAILLGAGGTMLGVSGAPVTTYGPNLDGTAIRAVLTGTSYTVPSGVSLIRFTQTLTIASQTVVLPTPIGDTHQIEFDNYAGPITAYSFSPAVLGWTNGSVLPASVSVKVRWDAADNTWHRIG